MFEDIISGKKETREAKPIFYVLEIYDNGTFRDSRDYPSSNYTDFTHFVDEIDKQCAQEKKAGILRDYSVSVNNIERKIKVDIHLKC